MKFAFAQKLSIFILLFCVWVTTPVAAAVISWTDWTARTIAALGSASGTITLPDSISIDVNYAGEVLSLSNINDTAIPSWLPASSYADGSIVTNAPPTGNLIALNGGNTQLNTITFSTPVIDPVLAIWSLGRPASNASFVFHNTTPVLVVGGPSNEFSGNSISVENNTVNGLEGNGTVQFIGTFNQLSWTNPTAEFYYGFTVGVTGIPEPSTYATFITSLMLFGFAMRRRALR